MSIANPAPGEIWLISRPKLGHATHDHPALILEVNGTMVTFNFMSSKFRNAKRELFRPAIDAPFYKNKENAVEWSRSGLWKDCFLIRMPAGEEDASKIEGKRIGVFTGTLLARAEAWSNRQIHAPTTLGHLLGRARAKPKPPPK